MPKIKSLIICTTPLQMMIAERIVASQADEDFYALIHTRQKYIGKYRHYGNKLIALCTSGTYIDASFLAYTLPKSLGLLCWLCYSFIFGMKHARITKVYISSYEAVFFRFLLARLPKGVEVYTFDDGLMNLLPSSYEHNKNNDIGGALGKVFGLLGIPQSSAVKARVKGHYTIYDAPNAAHDNPIKLDLFHVAPTAAHSPVVNFEESPISVFLGQPIYELGVGKGNKEVTEAIVKDLACRYYLPHPREDYKVDAVEYIDTEFVAEDYLLQELEKHPERCYIVYSYFSTTLIHLNDHPRVKMVACRPASAPGISKDVYELLERMGIEIREFPNI